VIVNCGVRLGGAIVFSGLGSGVSDMPPSVMDNEIAPIAIITEIKRYPIPVMISREVLMIKTNLVWNFGVGWESGR